MALLYADYEPAIQAPFQRGPYGTAWGAAFGNVKDLHLQRMKQGVLSRFPTFAAPDAIGQIALERQMVQGVDETLEHFVQRLLNPWGVWTEGGTYWGLLAELAAAGYDGIDGHGSVYIAASNGYVYGPGDDVTVPDPVNAYDPGATYLIPETGDVVVHVNATDLYRGRAQRGPSWTQQGAIPYVAGDRPIPSVGPFAPGTEFTLLAGSPLAFGDVDFSITVLLSVSSSINPIFDITPFTNYGSNSDPGGLDLEITNTQTVWQNGGPYLGIYPQPNIKYDALNVISLGYQASTQTMFLMVNGQPLVTQSNGGPMTAPTTVATIGNGLFFDGSGFQGQVYEVLASTNTPSDAAFTAIYDAVQANIRTIPGTPPGFVRIPPWYSFGAASAALQWAADTDYAVNAVVIPIIATGAFFICTQGGESGSIEPDFPGPGGSVTDGTATWTYAGNYTRAPVYPPWNFGGADGQGSQAIPTVAVSGVDESIGPGGEPSPDGAFWSRFVVIFDPMPSSWSSIANPPTTSSAPGSAEISVIREIIAKLKPAKSTCVGIVGLNGAYTRACWGWPLTTTPNIPNSNWMSRAISAGDVDAEFDFDARTPQKIESWLAHSTFTSGLGHVYMIPSSAWENANNFPTPKMLFEATGPAVTTGFIEPDWPTTIGDTVADGAITWTAIATLYRWGDYAQSTVFTF